MKRDLRKSISAIMFLGLALPGLALAQTYDIPVYEIGGSGGTSSGGSYQLSGTAGTPAGGISASGGSYQIEEGFWPAVQVLTAPTGGDTLIVDVNGAHDPDNGQYTTLQSVADTLANQGVTGPTTVLVKDGNYNWVTINPIPGTSPEDTVVFKPYPNHWDVIIAHTALGSSDNWVIKIDGAKHITIDGFTIKPSFDGTYARGIYLIGDTDNLNIINNTLTGSSYQTSTSTYGPLIYGSTLTADSVRIMDNTFIQGNYGIYFDGTTAARGQHNVITGNTFSDQYYRAIYMKELDSPEIGWNEIYARATASSGFDGIYVDDCDGAMEIVANWIYIPNGGTGIYHVNSGATVGDEGLIANNAINVDGGTNKTNSAEGIYLSNATYQLVYFNTVHITSWNANAPGLYVNTASTNLDVRNNIFSVSGAGLAMYYEGTSSAATSDFNLLHTRGNYLAGWGSVNYSSLADLQAVPSSQDGNSLDINPNFAGDTLFVPRALQLNSKGTNAILTVVSEDIDGNARLNNWPDMGAYEFDVVGTPMSGTYVVGVQPSDFSSITEALDSLNTLGIDGPTTLQFQTGTYTNLEGLPFLIPPIAGAGPNSQVTFLGDTTNPSAVTLQYAATGTNDNKVIQIDGADHIKIRGLRLIAQGADYATCIQITGGADDINISNNVMNGLAAAGTYDRRSLIKSDASLGSDRVFTQNTFEAGSFGIFYDTNISGNPLTTGTEVTGNSFVNQDRRGVFLVEHDAPIVRSNSFSTSSDDYNFHAIGLEYCDNETRVEQNTIEIRMGYGIYQYYCDGTASYPGLVVNNLITIGDGTTNYARGIYQNNVSYQNIYHNTVHITNTGASIYRTCFYNTGAVVTGSVNLQNNIFSNTGDGWVTYFATPTNIGTSNNNGFQYTGTSSFHWSPVTYSDLAQFQGGSGMDLSSLAGDPLFVDATNGDYHLSDISPMLGQGVDVGITADLEGTSRPLPLGSSPDMGAFENALDAPDTTPPTAPTGLVVTAGDAQNELKWDANTEPDLSYYNIYRKSFVADSLTATKIDSVYAPSSSYLDIAVVNNVTYYYWVTAVDQWGNEGIMSAGAYGTPQLPPFSNIATLGQMIQTRAVAWGDYDGDGDLDVLQVGVRSGAGSTGRLYRNDGADQFSWVDQIPAVGLLGQWFAPAAAWGDYDGDGDLDILLAYPSSTDEPISGNPEPITDIFENNGGSFTAIAANLPGIYNGAVAWGDYDNDGDLDVLLTGQDERYVPISAVYRNDDGTFVVEAFADISTPVFGGDAAWGDYDGDGDLDFIITGVDLTDNAYTRIYNNNGGVFSPVAGLADVKNSAAAWGDYDNDGDLDLALAGLDNSANRFTKIYRNDDGTFVALNLPLAQVNFPDVAWGDYDNDGDSDLLLAGVTDGDSRMTTIYRNDGSDSFTDVDIDLDSLGYGVATWGDYDNDGDLDILSSGGDAGGAGHTYVYRNNTLTTHTAPNIPDVQTFAANPNGDGSVTFSWGSVSDDKTATAGVTYNLRIGSAPGLQDVMPVHAKLDTGFLSVPGIGNVNHNTIWTVGGFPEATFYWSVQAIDAAFSASEFAGEQSFVTADPPAAPTGLMATAGNGFVELGWDQSPEADLAGYRLFRNEVRDSVDNVILAYEAGPTELGYADMDLTNGITYWYWLVAVDTAGNVSDYSPAASAMPFGPPQVTVIAPNGGEDWNEDTRHVLRWSANDEGQITRVQLLYSVDGGQSFTQIADSVNNDGVASWSIPRTPSQDALFMVSATDNDGQTVSDTSDGVFTIRDVEIYTHQTNDVNHTVRNDGLTGGFAGGVQGSFDPSLEFPPGSGNHHMYIGGLLLAGMTNNGELFATFDPDLSSTMADHFRPLRPLSLNTPGGFTTTQTRFEDKRGMGLEVFQRTIAQDDESAVIHVFVVKNTGVSTYTDLFAGFYSDFDISEWNRNAYGYDQSARTIYMWNVDQTWNSYAGIRMLDQDPLGMRSWGTNMVRTDPTTLSDLYNMLSQAGPDDTTGAATGDWRVAETAGPYALAPGDSIRIAYVLAAGSDLNDLLGTTQRAQDFWTSITVFPPIAEANAAVDVSTTEAILTGTVNPNGLSTQVFFQWAKQGDALGEVAADQADISGSEPVYVTKTITGLQPGTLYEYRIRAINGDGEVLSDIVPFETPVTDKFLPVADTPAVTDVHYSVGASWVDFNNDNLLDLFIANAGPQEQPGDVNALYQNQGEPNWDLNNVIDQAADLHTTDHSDMGVWGDYDNDGDLDVFVTNYLGEENVLYRNEQASGFAAVTLPFADDGGESDGASWADYDNDGDLDLFVANSAIGEVNFLYNNSGPNGTPAYSFTRVTGDPWDTDASRSRMGAWADYDSDGDLDLYVANSTALPNFLYENNGQNVANPFTKVVVHPLTADSTSSVSATWGDFDNDGDLDLYVANAANQANILYMNQGGGGFTKAPAAIGPIVEDQRWSYSGNWADYDNDGDLDMYVANLGNNDLYNNQGDGTFTSETTGLAVTDYSRSYGTAWGDYNNDGYLDLIITQWNGPNRLYTGNANERTNHWINLKLVGTVSNLSGIGAKVRLKATGSPSWQMQEVSTSHGWYSQNSLNVEFGLGTATNIDSIIVEWPSGFDQVLTQVAADQFLTVTEQPIYAPAARALPPTALTATSATLNGDVVPNGGSTEVWFQWGETTEYSNTTQVPDVQGGSEEQPVELPLTGLTANKTYHYRVQAANSAGTAVSEGMQFTTPADENTSVDIQIVVDGPVEFPSTNVTLGITFSSATGEDTITVAQVQGTPSGTLPLDMNLVTQQLWDISHFGTGVIDQVQFTLDVSPATISAEDQSDPSNIKLLRRDNAMVADWTVIAQGVSATQTVVTFSPISGFSQFTIGTELRGVAPTATTVAADNVTINSAVIKGTVNPGGLTTNVSFEWGTSTAYGNTIPAAAPNDELPPGTDPVQVSATLTGLAMDQDYHYRVKATNSEGTIFGLDQLFTTLFLDEEKPAIVSAIASVTPPVDVGTAVTITAEITDNVGVDQVALHHAPGGGQSYAQISMSPTVNANEYSAVIPQEAVTLRGVVCYVSAADAAGNDSASVPIFIGTRFGQGGLTTANVSNSAFATGFPKEQWRLLSVPAELAQASVNGTIGDDLGVAQHDTSWHLFEYTHNPDDQWRIASTFNPGESYWLAQRVSPNNTVELQTGAGQIAELEQFDINLQPGWNLIGTPYCFRTPIQLDDVDFWGPLTYSGTGWTAEVSFMEPWGGYAVYNNTATTQILTLSAEPARSVSKELLTKEMAAEPPAGWVLEIGAVGQTYDDRVNAIGRLEGAREELDHYDHPEPPYVDGYVSLAMTRTDWNADLTHYSSDIRSLEEQDGVWDIDLHFKDEQGPVNLDYTLKGDFPVDHKIILLDVLTREGYDLSAGESPAAITKYREDFPYHLKVVAGSADYVDNTTTEILAALPDRFALAQNYPNPFNPETHLRYSLYQPAKVTLKIFNLLGQEVVTLVDGWHDLGHYEVAWNGRDRFGNMLASGVYIAAYMAEGKIYSRKMVMMK